MDNVTTALANLRDSSSFALVLGEGDQLDVCVGAGELLDDAADPLDGAIGAPVIDDDDFGQECGPLAVLRGGLGAPLLEIGDGVAKHVPDAALLVVGRDDDGEAVEGRVEEALCEGVAPSVVEVEELKLGAPRVASLPGLAEEADGQVEESCLMIGIEHRLRLMGVRGWPECR